MLHQQNSDDYQYALADVRLLAMICLKNTLTQQQVTKLYLGYRGTG
jgi:hypothetical protein